ncbi:MAG: hypothetical protein RL283_997 [Actinomycetota bacterium]
MTLLDELAADPDVREVVVNRGSEVWAERDGVLARRGDVHPDEARAFVERALLPLGRRLDVASPIVDARLADGSRLCAVIPPIGVDGLAVAIRRFAARPVALEEIAPPAVAAELAAAVRTRRNLLVSGAAAAGKTTLLNTLCRAIDPRERIVTIEDVAELRLDHPHVVRFETRPPAPDGSVAVPVRRLVGAALRMRPDRLVIGEVRGDEVLDMLAAMNTGHDGSMSSLHANSAADALRRVESLVLQHAANWTREVVREHVRAVIDLIVHVERLPDGRRRVSQVAEIGDGGPRTRYEA